ncbi:aldehyde dehydrogenase family protein [Roseibium sediminicola]|uniref:Aldehyde dehydrogenase family protein n=1 Tax=Roseibium sediminicola TaxID=2933272 RepID=A0ABT0GZY0_9HYPH|nr:aldehyde dehydrogenase family protein [Roseibium sp. CAU 1639]MCK7614993.1 aldehyde dehydrogenase family protein [Roseibium sp. CAU 1639]
MNVASYFNTMDYAPSMEDDSGARAWLARHGGRFGHFIGGKFTAPSEGFETREPASGKVLAVVSQGLEGDVNQAVAAARKAQKGWAVLSGHERALKLYALARIIQRNARLLAVLEALDNGKPVRETRDIDIPLAARHFYHHAGWAQLQESQFPDHDPVGVIGQVIPWNFPLLMLAWKVAPALALGNTVVLKPAEATPLTALLFAELAQAAGLPEGVLNVVTGDGETGALVTKHEDIDKVAFTGSTEVGRKIREATAGSGKSLMLELGGKSPCVVFEDADLDAAVEGVVDAIWFNQGQVCCAGSRLLVHEAVAEDFHARLAVRMQTLRLGSSLDKTIDMGPVIDAGQRARIASMVDCAVASGAELVQAKIVTPETGTFYPPTLLCNVPATAEAATEEIFGPVAVSMTFRTPGEAAQLANHSRYGLAASIWSENINQALELAAKVEAGIVWVNCTNVMDAGVGFGGVKESGFGREGGREGCYDYLKPRLFAKAPERKPFVPAKAKGFTFDQVDRTAKLFIGGKQARPDGNYSRAVVGASGEVVGEVGEGNRKDIRNAVEAARGAASWGAKTQHNRAQILYYLGENLSVRASEFADRLRAMTGVKADKAKAEVAASVSRLFSYGAWADKFEGAVHMPPMRGLAIAVPEPLGVVGVVCPPELPLLGFVSTVAPLIAAGNRVVAVPSEPFPLSATDFYQVVETSDVPAGVLNIVTGEAGSLCKELAKHNDVDGLWAFGSGDLSEVVERLSTGNLKRTFTDYGRAWDWSAAVFEGEEFLRRATQVKTIWVPYGE